MRYVTIICLKTIPARLGFLEVIRLFQIYLMVINLLRSNNRLRHPPCVIVFSSFLQVPYNFSRVLLM